MLFTTEPSFQFQETLLKEILSQARWYTPVPLGSRGKRTKDWRQSQLHRIRGLSGVSETVLKQNKSEEKGNAREETPGQLEGYGRWGYFGLISDFC